MGIFTALAVGAVAAAGAVGSAVAKKNAANQAARIQQNSIKSQQQLLRDRLDPKVLNDLAVKADTERAQNRLALQAQVDPELAKLRTASKQELLNQAQIPGSAQNSTKLANTLFQETNQQDPRMEALKTSIINSAQNDISEGANLPPEFQAELVRSGLSTGAQAGIGVGKATIGGTTARLLGGAGIALQQQRQQQGAALAGTAQSLIDARARILATAFPAIKQLELANQEQAARGFQIADNALPQAGLSGQEAVNLESANVNAQAALLGKKADVSATQAINSGNATGAYIGAGTNLATSAIGAYAGGIGSTVAKGFTTNPSPGGAGYSPAFYASGPQ